MDRNKVCEAPNTGRFQSPVLAISKVLKEVDWFTNDDSHSVVEQAFTTIDIFEFLLKLKITSWPLCFSVRYDDSTKVRVWLGADDACVEIELKYQFDGQSW